MMRKTALTALLACAMTSLVMSAGAATAPLLPPDGTLDLYVADEGCECILRITPAGAVSIEITAAQIQAATGDNGFDCDEQGLAFDADGVLYIADDESDSILRQAARGMAPTLFLSEADIEADVGGSFRPGGMAFGSDGLLYVNDDADRRLLRIDTTTGVTSVHTSNADFEALPGVGPFGYGADAGIAAGEGGVIYTSSDNGTPSIFEIDSSGTPSILASGDPLDSIDPFMTRTPDGHLLQIDRNDANGEDTIHHVDVTTGVVTTFLSEADIVAVVGDDDLEGGMAFDGDGNFYVLSEDENALLVFDTTLTGSILVDEAAVQAVTGTSVNLECAIAFEPAPAGCGEPCDLTQLLQPLLPGGGTLPSTHPCFGEPVPTMPDEATCEGLASLLPLLPGSPSLSSTHPCFGVVAPAEPTDACCETLGMVLPDLPASATTHPCFSAPDAL